MGKEHWWVYSPALEQDHHGQAAAWWWLGEACDSCILDIDIQAYCCYCCRHATAMHQDHLRGVALAWHQVEDPQEAQAGHVMLLLLGKGCRQVEPYLGRVGGLGTGG